MTMPCRNESELAAHQRRLDANEARRDALRPAALENIRERLESTGFKTEGIEFLVDQLVSLTEGPVQRLRAALATGDQTEAGRVLCAAWARAVESAQQVGVEDEIDRMDRG